MVPMIDAAELSELLSGLTGVRGGLGGRPGESAARYVVFIDGETGMRHYRRAFALASNLRDAKADLAACRRNPGYIGLTTCHLARIKGR